MTDCLFWNGTVLTQDPARSEAEAVAVRGGRIVAVGRGSEVENLAGPGTRRIDLAGRTLVPGFNDAHVHVWKVGQLLTTLLDLRPARSLREIQERMRERSRVLAGGAWLLGRGYNEARLEEGRPPARGDLDAAVADRPVCLTRTCGHIAALNSRALAIAGISRATADPPGGRIDRDERGEPTGVLRETAIGLVARAIPEPSPSEYEAMIRAAHRSQLRRGVTSATDPGVSPGLLAVYRALDDRKALGVRMNVMAFRRDDATGNAFPLPERHVSDFLRVDSVKLFADGGLSGATAALRAPYRGSEDRGIMRIDEDELFDLAAEAQRAGLRVGTHAIGDRAIDAVLAVYEKLPAGPRPRLEHFGLPDAEQLRRAARTGAIAVAQPVFLHSLGENFRRSLPDDYLARVVPIRSMRNAGIEVALSSDAPVVPDDDPLLGIQAAVTRRSERGEPLAAAEAVSAAEALSGYTRGGALASGEEAVKGSITAGQWADLAVLSENPLRAEPESLSEIEVHMVFVGGSLVHET